MMENDGSYMTEKILDLTLEIIYLLTGEDYKVVKKTSGEHFMANNHSSGAKRKEKIDNKKILEVTQKIIELLTTEGWDHVEGHKYLYEDIKKENHLTFTLMDGSSNRNSPERSHHPLYSQDSTQEDHNIPHHYKVEDLVGIKVEIVEDEENLYLRAERPCLKEDIPTFVSPGGQHNREALGDPPVSNFKEEVEDIVQTPQKDNSLTPRVGLCQANILSDADRTIACTQTRSNDKVYPCSECGKCFTDTSNRIRHMKTHKGLKPFTCSECGKCFNRKSHLTGHQRVHTGEKPFSCSLCGKLFKHKSHLVIHNRTHTGEKPFTCPDCGKCFAQTANLLYHQKVHTAGNT